MSGVVEADAALPLVLVHDGTRVAVRETVLVRQPVGAFLTSEERWSRFQALEPLDQVTSGYGRDARDQILMRLQGVVQGHEHLQGRPTPCCRACTTGTSLTTPQQEQDRLSRPFRTAETGARPAPSAGPLVPRRSQGRREPSFAGP